MSHRKDKMASDAKPEVILYDLKCTKGVCFSPSVWRTRFILNYKGIPYETRWLEFPEIRPTLSELGVKPNGAGVIPYSVPTIQYLPTGEYVVDSAKIAEFLEQKYPEPALQSNPPERGELEGIGKGIAISLLLHVVTPREAEILSEPSKAYYNKSWEEKLGRPLKLPTEEEEEKAWKDAEPAMKEFTAVMNRTEGPFVLGNKPSYPDFYIAGFLKCLEAVDTELLKKWISVDPAFGKIYEATKPWWKRDSH